jgi:Ca2+-binding RTX toxin-like protein
VLLFATPSPLGVTIPISTPPPGSDIVGEPKLHLVYTGTGVSLAADGDTHLFAQIVDKQRNLIVNNYATPIKIDLDGNQHTLNVDLERIASRSTDAGYELQIIPQTNVYDFQRATGLVQISSADIELPLVEPVKAGDASCANVVKGTRRPDSLRGTVGSDRLRGKRGRDLLKGRAGDDCLKGGRGRDRVNCGRGDDIAFVKGPKDRLRGCERVRRRG